MDAWRGGWTRWTRVMVVLALAMACGDAAAQFASTQRLSNPNGRVVLELRRGTQPANPNLLFTAAITAGPTGGTTSVLLQQAYVSDIFNPSAPAAGWTTVRSTSTAFALGGGCGRNNLIDFPYINNNRPEILRITGTTHTIVTPGIPGNNDQYDSIDCVVQSDGRVLYTLSNRTRRKLELRRDQGNQLVLVRDNFGTIITPFVGGIRPAISRFWRLLPAPVAPASLDAPTGRPILKNDFVVFFLETIVPETQVLKILNVLDDEATTPRATCTGPTTTAPAGFTIPKEAAVGQGVALGPSRNDGLLWGDFFTPGDGGCTQLQPAESFGATGPFSQYTWSGVLITQPPPDLNRLWALQYSVLMSANTAVIIDNGARRTFTNPFAGRGGPLTGCALTGSEFDVAQLAIGPGPSNTQVQHSLIVADAQETIMGSSMEEAFDTASRCD